MEKKTSDTLFVILFIATFIFMTFVVYYMVSNKDAITKNPFIYGAKKMGSVECSCVQYHEQGQPSYFFFNDTTLTSGQGKSIISSAVLEEVDTAEIIVTETNITNLTEVNVSIANASIIPNITIETNISNSSTSNLSNFSV
jgi:hypothetical protein